MSKRFYPQQQGDRKRPRLDVSVSDHNFPLSQNKEPDADNWGDDNDDEILLLASQACEEVYNNDVSLLPNYSMFSQPGSSSTQIYPSTSKTEFTFKKPSTSPTSIVTTNLKEKCNRISSPLPGITAQALSKANTPQNVTENSLFNDKIYKNDSDHVYRQLLQLQEENEKLKSENGKLLEKCVTKEGEASILRNQLKSCQVSVDNARLEKIKAQEKVQMEWTDKLTAANNQMHDLRTQLDFKNLEIISIKEKCKKLESTKVRLTQVTVANNDISSSHRASTSYSHNESLTQRRVKTSTNSVQTEDKAHFLTLTKTKRIEDTTKTTALLPYILEPTASPPSILDNDKIQTEHHKCRVYSTFHRVPSNIMGSKGCKVKLGDIYEDVVKIVGGTDDKEVYYKVFTVAKEIFNQLLSKLETIKQRMTTPFQKEMDEKYIESTSVLIDVGQEHLLKGGPLYKDEQGILARRMISILTYIERLPKSEGMLTNFEVSTRSKKNNSVIFENICKVLGETSCATIYSGVILSIIYNYLNNCDINCQGQITIINQIIQSRPMGFVSIQILRILKEMSCWESFEKIFCARSSVGNLKTDYDQGVLLYKKDSCYIQIVLKQIEACLKCVEKQHLQQQAVDITRSLIILHDNCCGYKPPGLVRDKSRCECNFILIQVLVYALRTCAVMLQSHRDTVLHAICRNGVHIMYRRVIIDVEFGSQLAFNEGHLIEFCDVMRDVEDVEFYVAMLTELSTTLQSTPEDMPPSFHKQPWLKSFESFSMTD